MRHYSIEIADDPEYFDHLKYVVYRWQDDLYYCDTFSDARSMLNLLRLTDTIFYGLLWKPEHPPQRFI